MITPTIGRKVWFRPNKAESMARNGDQPMDATVVYVWNDRMVNLVIFDHVGGQHMRPCVLLMQGDESYVPVNSYCEWMPYQLGQAKPFPLSAHQSQALSAVSDVS